MTRESKSDRIHATELDDSDYVTEFDDDEIEIDRSDTGLRVLFTLLFLLILNVAEGVLMVLVLFQLGFALITQREPGPEIKRFANQVISYMVRIARYITYNESEAPFPFRELPEELDLTAPAGR